MKQFWAQLKPQERRVVTIIGVIVFLLLNWIFVWPKFKEWGSNSARIATSRENMRKFGLEIAHKGDIEHRINAYQSAGDVVQGEDQVSQFVNFLQDRALENGVSIQHSSGLITHTNDDFFVEREMNVEVQCNERNLVGFLYSLGASNSMMRARSMSLHAIEPTRYQLDANLKIVASYQRKALAHAPAVPAPPAARTTPAPAATPKPTAPAISKTTTATTTNKLGSTNIKRP